MNKSLCSICNNKMLDFGKIPDGELFKCTYCRSKEIKIINIKSDDNKLIYGNSYREKLDSTKVSHLIDLFENQNPVPSKKYKLLDIGFGNGAFLEAMQKKGLDVTGMECDQNAITLIREKGIEAVYGELGGDVQTSQKYDIITLWDVLEHVHDIETAMFQINSLSKENTKILILTPDAASILDTFADVERNISFYKSQKIMNICLNRYHRYRFSVKGLKILLERYGFVVEHIESLRLFSLKPGEYSDGFAPGILRWTPYSSLNKIISISAMSFIKIFNIKNKIFLTAIKK